LRTLEGTAAVSGPTEIIILYAVCPQCISADQLRCCDELKPSRVSNQTWYGAVRDCIVSPAGRSFFSFFRREEFEGQALSWCFESSMHRLSVTILRVIMKMIEGGGLTFARASQHCLGIPREILTPPSRGTLHCCVTHSPFHTAPVFQEHRAFP
jgi:hypothetical protein